MRVVLLVVVAIAAAPFLTACCCCPVDPGQLTATDITSLTSPQARAIAEHAIAQATPSSNSVGEQKF